jgi:hypothetical protein
MKFTALLRHVTVDPQRDSFSSLKRKVAPGVDGVIWQAYGAGLENRLADLHSQVGDHCVLDDLVFQCGDPERTLPSIALLDVDPYRWKRPIRVAMPFSEVFTRCTQPSLIVSSLCQAALIEASRRRRHVACFWGNFGETVSSQCVTTGIIRSLRVALHLQLAKVPSLGRS